MTIIKISVLMFAALNISGVNFVRCRQSIRFEEEAVAAVRGFSTIVLSFLRIS